MKKAKMLLTAIAIFAVVGTALAFKTHAINGTKVCRLVSEQAPGACDAEGQYKPAIQGQEAGDLRYCKNIADEGDCTNQIFVTQDDF